MLTLANYLQVMASHKLQVVPSLERLRGSATSRRLVLEWNTVDHFLAHYLGSSTGLEILNFEQSRCSRRPVISMTGSSRPPSQPTSSFASIPLFWFLFERLQNGLEKVFTSLRPYPSIPRKMGCWSGNNVLFVLTLCAGLPE
jgi:hypothetical protein